MTRFGFYYRITVELLRRGGGSVDWVKQDGEGTGPGNMGVECNRS